MSRHARCLTDVAGSTILLALAAVLVRLLLTGEYLTFVRPAMVPFLTVTAGFLAALAGWTLRSMFRPHQPGSNGDHTPHLPAIAWLLLWPVLAMVVVAPQSLGAFTAGRAEPAPPPSQAAGFLPLPAGDPLAMPLDAYVGRASYGGASTLEGRRFEILGFVSPGPQPDSWYLTRLMVQCCAADAVPLQIRAVGAAPQSEDDWLFVTGTYLPNGPDDMPELKVEKVAKTDRPKRPYIFG